MKLEAQRLKKGAIGSLFSRGKCYRDAGFSIRVLPVEEGTSRAGFVIRKKTGNAVKRNFLRRLFRGCFLEVEPSFKKKHWVLFDVYPKPFLIHRKELREKVFAILRTL